MKRIYAGLFAALCLSAPLAMAAPEDHPGFFRIVWELEIDGVRAGVFRTVEGLDFTMETLDYTAKRPGRLKWENVTLKKGTIQNRERFSSWLAARSSSDVVIVGHGQHKGCRWKLGDARLAGAMRDAEAGEHEIVVRTKQIEGGCGSRRR